jgi:hypothetical protein
MNRWLFRIGTVLFALLLITFIIWRLKLAHDVNSQLTAIRTAGLPTSGAELNAFYPSVPDSENAALVITQAFAFMANYPDERSNAVAHFELPTASQPLTLEQKDLLAGYVESNRTAIQTAMQGLLRTKSRYPIDLSPGFATLLPHLAHLKNLAQAISFDGMLAVENGRPKNAIQSIVTILQLSKTLKDEPLLISALIRFRMDKMAKLTFERCLNAQPLDEENLAVLDHSFLDWEGTNRLCPAMIGERAAAIPLFQMNFAQFSRFVDSPDIDIREVREEPGAVLLTSLMRASGFFERDLRFYLAVMETNIDLSRTSYPPDTLGITNVWNDAMREIEHRHLVMSAMLLPALDLAYFKDAESIANIRLSRVALVIERFRILKHRLPLDMNELDAMTTPETRTDPFDGQPLRYKRLEKGYEIYSVGKDGHDNGGKERPADAKSSDKTEYDITFTVER